MPKGVPYKRNFEIFSKDTGYYVYRCPVHGLFLFDRDTTHVDDITCMVPHQVYDALDLGEPFFEDDPDYGLDI